MTRVATAFFSFQALTSLTRSQNAFQEAQRQSAEQTISDNLQGYGRTAETLISANNLRDRAQSFLSLGKDLNNRLAQQDLGLGRAAQAATDLQQKLTEALTLDDGSFIVNNLQDAFDTARQGLNLRYNGQTLFNGVSNDTDPVKATQLSDLTTPAALADINTIFDSQTQAQTVRVDENVTLTTGPLARNISGGLFSSFQRVQQFLTANPTIGRPLTQTQRDFLTTEIGNVSAAADQLRAAQGVNGLNQARLNRLGEDQTASVNLLTSVASKTSSVDLAEVAARLSQAQQQFQASASVFKQIQQLSLVNFLQ